MGGASGYGVRASGYGVGASGYGSLVIIVSAQVLWVLTLGLWTLDLGLTIAYFFFMICYDGKTLASPLLHSRTTTITCYFQKVINTDSRTNRT